MGMGPTFPACGVSGVNSQSSRDFVTKGLGDLSSSRGVVYVVRD